MMLSPSVGRSTSLILLIAVGACLTATPVFAQGGTVDVSGTVFDQSKAVLPGVTVTLVNENTGQQRTAVTADDGRFSMPTLLPGVADCLAA
jgi:Carboxypeptidase regulatory-like domain